MGRALLAGNVFTAACLLAGSAAAQVSLGAAQVPGVTVHRAEAPPSSAAPPPPAMGHAPPAHHAAWLPFANGSGDDLFRAGPHTYAPRFNRHVLLKPHQFGVAPFGFVPFGFMTPGYFPTYYPAPVVDVRRPYLSREIVGGILRLQVQPASAQVFVDGDFVGSVQDSGGRFFLEPGSHRVEVIADGFETVTFDVRIRPNETITYRKELRRTEARDATPAAPIAVAARAAPKTLYVIPRCYAGDKRPVAAELPAGCNPADLRMLPPPTR